MKKAIIFGLSFCLSAVAVAQNSADCLSQTQTVCGLEKVTTHKNGGGTVSLCADISEKAQIDDTSTVCGKAEVGPFVNILNDSSVSGEAKLTGDTTILNSEISEQAVIDNSVISEYSEISGTSKVLDSEVEESKINGNSQVTNSVIVNSTITSTQLPDESYIEGDEIIDGKSTVINYEVQ